MNDELRWKISEQSASGIRRFDALPLRMLGLVSVVLIATLAISQTPLPRYLNFARQQAAPSIAFQGVQQAAGNLAVEFKNAAFVARAPQASVLQTIRLEVPKNTLLEMFQALHHGDPELNHEEGGDKPYFKARVQVDDLGGQRCKVCLRGTMPWHHDPGKPSLRIRIKKEDLAGGPRYWELSRPEDALAMKNWLPSVLAKDMGLLHENYEHVRVFINGKYFGVYLRSMRQTELMALRAERMPGTFFKGDFGGDLWASMEPWRVEGEQHPQDIALFSRFLTLLSDPPSATQRHELRKVIDFERYAQWAALMIVTGSLHTDQNHNHSYFFSSNLGKLEPIPWDTNSFGIHCEPNISPDVVLHPVMQALIRDSDWVQRRNEIIWQLMEGAASTEALSERIREQLANLRADLEADPRMHEVVYGSAGWISRPVSVIDVDRELAKLEQWIVQREAFLRKYFEDCRLAILTSENPSECIVRVQGNVAIKVEQQKSGEIAPGSDSWVLPVVFDAKRTPGISQPFEGQLPAPYLTTVTRTYRVPVNAERLVFRNSITGAPLTPEHAGEVISAKEILSAVAVSAASPKTSVTIGPGEVVLKENLTVSAGQRLQILPGTDLRLHPGVGIYSAGPVLALGTKEQPISIKAWDQQGSDASAWAAVAVYGKESAGSQFAHVTVEGGSVGEFENRRFKGMFDAYNCPDIRLSHCHFGRNWIGDDAVNLAQSRFKVTSCTWTNARADALDCDMSVGEVEDSHWFQSGNDAIDLMTCRVRVSRCFITGSGDKGISVGEDSRLEARDVVIERCSIGTEIKDDSWASFTRCNFENNRYGAHAYQKKWFYSRAGHAEFESCKFIQNSGVDVHLEKRSLFRLRDTEIESYLGAWKRIHLDQKQQPRHLVAVGEAAAEKEDSHGGVL